MIPRTIVPRFTAPSIIVNDKECSVFRNENKSRELSAALPALDIEATSFIENASSRILYQQHSRRSIGSMVSSDDDDSLSRYDYSVRASSDLDRNSFSFRSSVLASMDTMDSADFQIRGDAAWIANTNIARYTFEMSHYSKTTNDEGGCGLDEDGILGCIKAEVEKCKRELRVSDDAKIALLLGRANESPSVTYSSASSSKQSQQSPQKKSVTKWLTGIMHRAPHFNIHSKKKLQTNSLQAREIRRAEVPRSISFMRQASF